VRRRGRVVAVIITAAAVPPASWRSFGEAGVPSTTMSKMASSLKADVAGTGVNMMMNEIHLIACSRQARALYHYRTSSLGATIRYALCCDVKKFRRGLTYVGIRRSQLNGLLKQRRSLPHSSLSTGNDGQEHDTHIHTHRRRLAARSTENIDTFLPLLTLLCKQRSKASCILLPDDRYTKSSGCPPLLHHLLRWQGCSYSRRRDHFAA
jgi:hypothetical protein